MGRSTFDLSPTRAKVGTMNKVLLLAFFSVALITVTYGESQNEENSLSDAELSEIRVVRDADPKKQNRGNVNKKKKRNGKKKVTKKNNKKKNKNNNKKLNRKKGG